MKNLIITSIFVFTFFSCKTSKIINSEDIRVTFVNSKDNYYNVKIKNNTNNVVVLLDVFTENKIRDINFFLQKKNRILIEKLALADAQIVHDEKVIYDFFSVKNYAKYDSIEKFIELDWQNIILKPSDFIFILPNETEELKYIYEPIKTYHSAYKEYNLSEGKKYKFQIIYKIDKEEIFKKCTEELKLLIQANNFNLYDKEILSNFINYTFNEKKGLLSSIKKRKKYWYTDD